MAQKKIGKWSHKEAGEKYDVIVIGAGLSGMGVGGLLAKAGKKVIILEKSNAVGGKARSVETEGITFDLGPHVIQEKGFEEKLTDLLGKGEELRKIRVPFIEKDVKLAAYKNGKWVDLYSTIPTGPEIEKVSKTIAAIKPEDIPKYDSISVGDWIKGITSDENIIYFVHFFSSVMCTHADPNNMSTGTYLRLLRLPTYDPAAGGLLCYYPKGGMGGWMKLLEEGCREKGATIRTNSEVTKILVENDEVKGVLVEEGDRSKQIRFHGYGEIGEVKRIEAPIIVTSFPIWDLFSIITEDHFPTWFVEWAKGFEGKTTAILGFWVTSKEPILKEKWFVLTESPRTKLPFVILPLTNLVPELAPKGIHFLNQVSLCELDMKKDRERIYDSIELLKEDMDEFYPGWRDKVTSFRPYFFDFEEPSHMPTHFGIFRPGPKAPKVSGLYFTGESVNSNIPTMEGTSESAIICAKEILGTEEL